MHRGSSESPQWWIVDIHFGLKLKRFCSNGVLLCALSKVFLRPFAPRSDVVQCHAGDGLPTPSGWYEVVRGPRPQSVQWPWRQQWCSTNQWVGQWPAVSESQRTPVRRRWHRNNVLRLNPDEAKAAARIRVDRLEIALAALGETESAEVRGLHAALKEAQRAAQERPLAAQVEECQAFIKRSQARLVRLEQEQVREQKELDAALARMARFREEMTREVLVVPPPAESNATQPARVPNLERKLA